MLHAFGDSRRPLLDTANVVEDIVRLQMREILCRAAECARKRSSATIGLEDILFLMRKSPLKVQRFIKYLSVKDTASSTIASTSGKVTDMEGNRRVKRCENFISLIDNEGGLLTQALNEELHDECRLERLKRLDRLSRDMDERHYAEFTRARQVSFLGHKHRFSQKFYLWLTTDATGKAILADELTDLQLDQSAMEAFAYLAYETVGQVVDMALLIRQEERGSPDPVARQITPVVYNTQQALATMQNQDNVKEDQLDNVVWTTPLEPYQIREAVRRLTQTPPPLGWYAKVETRPTSVLIAI